MNLKHPTLLFVFSTILLNPQIFSKHFWSGTTMSTSDVKKKWGTLQFEEKKFQKGDSALRAQMTYSILQNSKQYLGKSVVDIRKALGPHDGFYYKDVFPAYLIHIGKNKKEETWQIVFELDSKRNVIDIFVHKNCCY